MPSSPQPPDARHLRWRHRSRRHSLAHRHFQSAAAINIALGKFFVHQITGRISRQDALALAYNCQLLLQTLAGVKAEIRDSGYAKYSSGPEQHRFRPIQREGETASPVPQCVEWKFVELTDY